MPNKRLTYPFVVLFAGLITALPLDAADGPEATTYEQDKRKVTLTRPQLIHCNRDYLWFPSLHRINEKSLFVVMSTYADEARDVIPARFSYSSDGGKTWSKPFVGNYSELMFSRADGSLLMLPYYLRFHDEATAYGTAQRLSPRWELNKVQAPVEVSGWPRKIGLLDADLGNPKAEGKPASFVFNGQSVLSS